MSFLARLEQFCAGLIERAFAKTFPSDLEPAQIARKLVATMEAQTRDEDGRTHAPGVYSVFVNPDDYARLESHRDYLERAWAQLLRELAAKVGVAFDDGPSVTMTVRDNVTRGAIAVQVGRPAASPQFRLHTVEGVPPDGVYSIAGAARIGRSAEGEIVLVDPSVSRAHAVVEVASGGATVRDLGSTNGTYLNGRRIETGSLHDGDELRFGNTRMRVETQ